MVRQPPGSRRIISWATRGETADFVLGDIRCSPFGGALKFGVWPACLEFNLCKSVQSVARSSSRLSDH
jgi:hypothetical protein